MRILMAMTYYRPHYSGLTIYSERVARSLTGRGHQVTILTSRFDRQLLAHEFCDGIEVIRPKVWFHVSKGVIMPGMPAWAWKLTREADIIHLHVPQLDAAPIALTAKLLGKPVVLTYHCDLRLPGGFIHAVANRVSNLANHITAGTADIIVHNSRDYAEHSRFLRSYLHKILPVCPPVEVAPSTASDLAAFRQKHHIQPGQRIIGMAARLATEKGVEYLVQALPRVLERFPEARVLFVGPYQNVVGEEAYAQRIAPMIQELGHHWTFLGIVSPVEMSAFFHECAVTVLPSLNSTESFGIVQVESMFCETPVVASDLPGVRVPITETGMGQIVPPADSQALAEALIAILENPPAYKGHPEKILHQSAPEAVAAEYEAIFERLINERTMKTVKSNKSANGLKEYR